ncbi:MAG: fused MFS/spermidine synthase [Bacteroidales bacterium]|nr:fused MFS/spermidine synthase [Lentimicrobiaceae bacterium]MDD5694154.1 fused MFS/spermidine synthase [Bacteroidales bacterium]
MISVLVAGFTSITVQIILLREFLVIFNGNELVYGIILANWMLLTGVGSYLGRWADKTVHPYRTLVNIQWLMAILPVIITFLLSYLRSRVISPGRMLSVIEVFYSSFALLLPFCLLSGYLFTLLSSAFSREEQMNRIGKVYGFESLGSMAGGVVFNFILVYLLNTFQSLTVIMTVNLLAACYISLFILKGPWRYAIPFLSVLCILFMILSGLESRTLNTLYRDQEVVGHQETPYGKLVVTRTEDQLNLYENGVVLFTTNDIVLVEESVHYAMIQHPDAWNILLIGGGMTGMFDEIRKYNVERIDYVEIDPWVVRMGEEIIGSVRDTAVHIHYGDARLFVKRTVEVYDVVMINLPEPSTAHFNRYYSVEFFKALKNRLRAGGVICTGLASSANYMSGESLKANSILYNSLRSVFSQVILVQGRKNFYLASDSVLTYRVAGSIDTLGIENVYVNAYYLNDDLVRARGEQVIAQLDRHAGVNQDLRPLAYYHQLRLWLSYFHTGLTLPLIIVLIIFLVCVVSFKPVSLGLFTGGFTSASVEFILIIVFQIIYGYVYQMTGVIIMTFMGGLALGSLFVYRLIPGQNIRTYTMILLSLTAFCLLLPLLIRGMAALQGQVVIIHIVFLILILVFSVLTGIQFKLSTLLSSQQAGRLAGTLYAADLFGSAFGALLMAAILLPLLGLNWVCLILGAMNLLAAVNVYLRGA